MSEQPNKFYLTTPIYYVNARPHIGHAYTTIVADVLARRHRLLGDDTFFLTGTDEHGQKIERSAAASGIPPQQFTDEVSAQFRALWDRMGLTYDRYIRTTDPIHKQGAQKLFTELYNRGYIYLSTYTGAYCVSDEAFVDLPVGTPCPDCGRLLEQVTEENFFFKLSKFQEPLISLIEANTSPHALDWDVWAKGTDYKHGITVDPTSARNEVLRFLRGNVDEVISELQTRIRSGEHFIPGEPPEDAPELTEYDKTELLGFNTGRLAEDRATGRLYVPGALKDLSVSRSSFTWGIPVPDAVQKAAGVTQNHIIYVWLDALANYITAIGYGSEKPADEEEFKRYWPAELQLVGKEITRFHCVYWPAFLMAAGLPTPKQVTANGWLLFDNAKMSKSRGNVVRTETILDAFGNNVWATQFPDSTTQERDLFSSDVLRYFLLREIPFGQDGSFSFDAMITRYNADLANGYGNLVSRTLAMVNKFFDGEIPNPRFEDTPESTVAPDGFDASVLGVAGNALQKRLADLGEADFTTALTAIVAYITVVDGFITAAAPWKLAKDPAMRGRLATVLYVSTEAIRWLTGLLHAYIPFVTTRVWAQLGLGSITDAIHETELRKMHWGGLRPGTKLGQLAPVFPRAEKSLAQVMIDMENENSTPRPEAPLKSSATPAPAAPVVSDPTHPAAPPRALDEPSGTLPVAGSSAVTTERTGTPSHSEAPASGIFAGEAAKSTPQITIDDFAKVELRVAQILVVERIPKADKLLRLEVDLGYEKRQILSGIAEWYKPEELVGRRIVVITNLAPRKMRGLESHGMLLAASKGEGGKPVLATFGEDIALGSRLK